MFTLQMYVLFAQLLGRLPGCKSLTVILLQIDVKFKKTYD